ncbi:dedicator of cytokinesis protein 1-like isoform X4 [Branchiostoma floridae]|uniref:Dedicator of cytokinesis protein 1-like isoform X4 n=1 Tax=Branchiostoma floridae TaxID=7739 RepID=A0A9J7L2W5_BRAFL|nr:dedicator of cytokinesis protein 1-like isoform X4 [Branchiostoma floridae]
MTRWVPTTTRKYAVAIYNYHGNGETKLDLTVGDTLHILEENDGWFRGFKLRNKSVKGIFPTSYVHIKQAMVENAGKYNETVAPKEPKVVQEMTTVLREWGVIWKQLYVDRGNDPSSVPKAGKRHSMDLFDTVRKMMYEMIDWRRQIMSGTLPVDELKELQQLVTSKIDFGNRLLGLDLVVRDEQGGILDPETTGTISLYRAHETATERIQREKSMQGVQRSSQTQATSHNLYVVVKNFVCRVGEDADVFMALYDAKENRFISENYVVSWSPQGMPKDIEMLNNLRAIFTDLGQYDLRREKICLLCQIIRVGRMDLKEADNKKFTNGLRRPFGVAVMDITDVVNGKMESDIEKQHFIPFQQVSGDNDFLEGVIKKVVSARGELNHKGQGLWVSMKMLDGDIKQVRKEYPHLVDGRTAVARKMGFPEVIMPGDVRNDMYVTLVSGEFDRGTKARNKNVEVTMCVCKDDGSVVQNVIFTGAGVPPVSEYKSVIYYQQKQPRWMETIKVAIPIEDFYGSHLKFAFRHRSSMEEKDRKEKIFAIAYVQLMMQEGTTLRDGKHDLAVYKCERYKPDEAKVYVSLPALDRQGVTNNNSKSTLHAGNLTLSKDSFQIQTLGCSTKLTQNVDLLGLLKWRANPGNLKNSLLSLMKVCEVSGEEVVKFLQDVLDALFNILMENQDSDLYDNLVFDALIGVIGLIADRKFHQFHPVLDTYIREHFSATLAYNKLMVVLKYYIDNANERDNHESLLKAMKSLQYIFKFIVRSRVLYSQLYEGKGKQQFEAAVRHLFQSLNGMMTYTSDSTVGVQRVIKGAALRYVPTVIPDVITVFDPKELSLLLWTFCSHLFPDYNKLLRRKSNKSLLLKDFINNIPPDRLVKQKVQCMNNIVHSDLFRLSECRGILLPMMMAQLKKLIERKEEMPDCVKMLSDVLDRLNRKDVGPIHGDMEIVMKEILRTVIQTVIFMDRDAPLIGSFVACMTGILRQMNEFHYQAYIDAFPSRSDLLDFLMEIFMVFRDLVSKNVYPRDWVVMTMHQNHVVLTAIKYFTQTLHKSFLDENNFEYQLWNNFFHLAVSFLTQESLQLENFSHAKRMKIINKYQDMRRVIGFEILSMWFNLGQHKIKFIPEMVGPMLEMTLIPETKLREHTIPIFFDMMQCEFATRGNFNQVENEIITQLDHLVEGGRGDDQYKELFYRIISDHCQKHRYLRQRGLYFVDLVNRLLERLLDYRTIMNDENRENRMSCTVNLLNFYKEINRQEMYIRYLYKLCDLHLECDNYTEAAYTLLLHATLLKWTDEPLITTHDKYPEAQTHRQLKEMLYYDIIEYFDKGKMWEEGIRLCKELASQYENETFDFLNLSLILQKQAMFYDNIMKTMRPDPEYFRVGYFGQGYPSFLRNKVFIYRGKEYERLGDFTSRLLSQFPHAQPINKVTAPGPEILESPSQHLQIFKVDPILEERREFRGKPVADQILNFYKVNEVQKFTFSRPIRKGDRDSDNEFANMFLERTNYVTAYKLPGILRWFEVTSTNTFEVSPLENACEIMENSNTELRHLIEQQRADPTLTVNTLSLRLNGIIDAAVMGGTANYEKAFFTEEYMASHPEDHARIERLKDLIACQIPLLEAGLKVHAQKAPDSLRKLQEKMDSLFVDMKTRVESEYGKKPPMDETTRSRPMSLVWITRNKPVDRPVSTISTSSTSSDGLINSKDRPSTPETGLGPPQLPQKSVRHSSQQQGKSSPVKTWVSKTREAAAVDGPVVELKETLKPARPMRPVSQPRISLTKQNGVPGPATPPPKVNRDVNRSASPAASVSSTSSSSSDVPPPLPEKKAYADYGNIAEDEDEQGLPPPLRVSSLPKSKSKPVPPLPIKEGVDPSQTPPLPKKPSRHPSGQQQQ